MSEDPQIVSISSNTPFSPDEIARKSFPAVRKGIDGEAVRAYLVKVAAELRGALEREATTRELLVEAERRAADPVLDEATLTKAIGVETAKILSTAHEAARNLMDKAEAEAGEMLAKAKGVLDEQVAIAEGEAAAIRAGAEQEAYEYAGRAQAEADSMTEEAHSDAVELLDATKDECRRMVTEARDLRNRTLADLVARRRALRVQLEELRGGKDSLLQVVDSVGAAVDQLRERLSEAERAARDAAEEAGERAEGHVVGGELGELEAELASVGRVLGEEPASVAEDASRADVDAAAPDTLTATDDSGATGDRAGEDQHPSASRRSVDELFARIRASRAAEDAAATATEPETAVVDEAVEVMEASATGEGVATNPDSVVAESNEQPALDEPASAAVVEPAISDDAAPEDSPRPALDAEHTAEYVAILVEAQVTPLADSSPADGPPADGSVPVEGSGSAERVARGEVAPESLDEAERAPAAGSAVFDVEALAPDTRSEAVGGGAAGTGEDSSGNGAVQAKAIDPDAITEPDVESLARRDHLLSPVTAKLGRALKRALQDDQNELLNALRKTNRKQPALEELIPIGVQLQRFVAAASDQLAKAYEAGAAFLVRGDAVEGPSVSAPPPSETTSFQAGTALAAELADDLSGVLRLRIEEALSELDGSLEGSADAAGIAYREWKGSRVEGLAGDFTTRAFAVGELAVLASVSNGGAPLVRWAVEDDDGGGSCPDCDDNSLAGPQTPGSLFPTGHSHPPVHPGCRCLLVPVRS